MTRLPCKAVWRLDDKSMPAVPPCPGHEPQPECWGWVPMERSVADMLANRIAAVPNALTRNGSVGTGKTISQNGALDQPLGVAIAHNGNIVSVNAGDGNIVETTTAGSQVKVKNIDTSGAGAGTLFGLALTPSGKGLYFVDDGDNTLDLLH
jgi:hypothetical protein